MHLSRYLRVFPAPQKEDHYILYSTLRSSTALVSGATLRKVGAEGEMTPEHETLQRLGMLVPEPAQEREQMRTALERASTKSRNFKAVVILNLDCNLDCSYCYEAKFRHEQYMTQETAKLLVETLLRERTRAGFDLSLVFYGGEPLLSEDLIRTISLPLLEGAREHGVNYNFTLVTNGTLLNRDMAQRLIPLGLKGAKFTLDGAREVHDRERPYVGGAGSFDAIVENLKQIWDIVPVHLGGNFRQENYREFPRLLDHLLECGMTPEKILRVQFTPVTPKSGCAEQSSAGCSCSYEPWLAEAILFLRQEIMKRGFSTVKMTHSACMVEFSDNAVVNWDGSIYKCPAFIGWDGLSIGTLADGIADYSLSHGIGNWKTEECLDCPYLPLCYGGCRFLNLLQKREMSQVDCRREFLDATLEGFILQNISHPTANRPRSAAAS